MSYIEVAKIEDISEGEVKPYEAGGKEIIIIKYKGSYYAMDRRCTHMKADLSKGKLEGNVIICPRHGSRFDVTTGKNLKGPKIGFLKLKTEDEKVYAVEVEDGKIKVDL